MADLAAMSDYAHLEAAYAELSWNGFMDDAIAVLDAMREPTDAMRAAGREAFLKDMRDRRLLKWLFPKDPTNHGAIGYIEGPIDLETQMDCASTNSGKSWQAQIDAAKEER